MTILDLDRGFGTVTRLIPYPGHESHMTLFEPDGIIMRKNFNDLSSGRFRNVDTRENT